MCETGSGEKMETEESRRGVCSSLSLSLCLTRPPEKGVSACLPLKGREGSVHGYPSLLLSPSVISLSLSFPHWQPQD